jgi:tetratricopeptide (TPR) repeat protein
MIKTVMKMPIKRAALALVLFLAAGPVRAEDCPNEAPEDPGLRRGLAKKWFAKGESEAKAGNDVAALKAYQCSLSFVPHGFTAYNVAQLAEKTGDLEVAIASYGQYLLLMPDAKDAKEVSERVEMLKDRLAKVRSAEVGPTGPTAQPPLEHLAETPATEPPPQTVSPPLVQSPPAETVEASDAATRAAHYRLAAWITTGAGGVLVLGGVLTNVLARGQMDTCRSEYDQGNIPGAESACSNAKPLAYMSYAFLGVGAAAVAAGTALFFVHPGESSEVGMNLLPEGGLALRYGGRF